MPARVCSRIFAACVLTACAGSEDGPKPILAHGARDRLRCEVTSELRDFGLRLEDVHDQRSDIVSLADDALWIARTAEGAGGLPRLVVSPLSLSAEGGEDQLVDEDAQHVAARTSIALPGGGFAVLWIREDLAPSSGVARSLWFAAFDPAGTPTVTARRVEGLEPDDGLLLRAAVSSSGNIGVLYRGPDGSARFATLDQVGDPWGASHAALAEVSVLAALPDAGFVMLGQDTASDRSLRPELLFAKIEETSETQAAPAPIARAGSDRSFWMGAALLPLERGYLVAWSEAQPPRGDSSRERTGGHAIIRLRRLDEQGQPLTVPLTLRAARDNISDHRPVLAQLGEHVALFWSTAAYSYDCEDADACRHRVRGQFVLLDPDDLTPRSDLIELLRDPDSANGRAEPALIGATLNVRDREVLVTATLQDDADSLLAPGFATLRCE